MIRIILAVLLIAAALTIWDARTATTEKLTRGYIDSYWESSDNRTVNERS